MHKIYYKGIIFMGQVDCNRKFDSQEPKHFTNMVPFWSIIIFLSACKRINKKKSMILYIKRDIMIEKQLPC